MSKKKYKIRTFKNNFSFLTLTAFLLLLVLLPPPDSCAPHQDVPATFAHDLLVTMFSLLGQLCLASPSLQDVSCALLQEFLREAWLSSPLYHSFCNVPDGNQVARNAPHMLLKAWNKHKHILLRQLLYRMTTPHIPYLFKVSI